ncbi:hypothetical protein, partial [Frankia sp. Cr1]|uniref:hypothetical protein n=1 Tax=Frankia sp. Cr1 TaxID=3073931 RepID=UPI002AD2E09D
LKDVFRLCRVWATGNRAAASRGRGTHLAASASVDTHNQGASLLRRWIVDNQTWMRARDKLADDAAAWDSQTLARPHDFTN